MNLTIETHIAAITVYADRALVTRYGKVQLTGKEQELTLADLPLTLQTDSVRVDGTGKVAVRLLGVRTERIFATEPVGEKVAQLSQQIEDLEQQKRALQDESAAVKLQRHFVQSLSEQSITRFSRGLAKQEVGLNETLGLLEFVRNQYRDYATAIATLEHQQKSIDKQLSTLRKQLKQIQIPNPSESFSLNVTIDPATGGEFELEVSYIVNRASWEPLYDLHANTQESTLNLTALAEVKQSTGEDWHGVALTLSTAKPGLGSLPPKLQPWYIDLSRPPTPAVDRVNALMARKRSGDEYSDLSFAAGASVLSAEQNVPEAPIAAMAMVAEVPVAEMSKTGSVVTFQVGGGSNIPSDGNPHQVTIFNDDYPASLNYIAMPRLVSFPYLQATVVNPIEGATLLSGKANIFRDRTFIGTTQLNNTAPGETFQLNLGIDEGLKIERDLVERQVDKTLIANQRKITYAYRLVVENLLVQATQLTLTEQIPASRSEKLKVRLTQTKPKINLGEMGILAWELMLSPQAKQELYYQFVVEYPPDETVLGLEL